MRFEIKWGDRSVVHETEEAAKAAARTLFPECEFGGWDRDHTQLAVWANRNGHTDVVAVIVDHDIVMPW